MATTTKSSTDQYAISGGVEGKIRLNLLAEIMRPTTLELLSTAGLKAGDRCLDVGCGGGHVTLDLARGRSRRQCARSRLRRDDP